MDLTDTVSDQDTAQELARLEALLRELGSVVVGYSGGVDSTVVAAAAWRVLGEGAVAVVGESEAFPAGEVAEATAIAASVGFPVTLIRTHELSNPKFSVNSPDRCYHCKTELFGLLRSVASERGIAHVADGSNADDVGDYRPGRIAGEQLGVRSPLQELGIDKATVRRIARLLGLPNAERPSFACLSSRFPYGTEITHRLLSRVDACEKHLRSLGFRQYRVRHHGDVCRIEVPESDILAVLERRAEISAAFRGFGYIHVALDLDGYRTGKMNDALRAESGLVPFLGLSRQDGE